MDTYDDEQPRGSRLYRFPGGVLETTDYGEGADGPGVFLEFEADRSRLPQRFPGAVGAEPLEHADAETCGRVLGLLRHWDA